MTLLRSGRVSTAKSPVRGTAVDTVIGFTTRRSALQVAEAFRTGMDLPVGIDSPIFGQLYIANITTEAIEFVSSSNRGRAFSSRLDLTTPKRTGTSGLYRVHEWNAAIATDGDLHQLEIVERRIRLVLESIGATVA